MGTRVFRGRPLDDDDGVDASSALSLVEVEFAFESDAIGKNLAMPSLNWSGLMDLPYALRVWTGCEVMLS